MRCTRHPYEGGVGVCAPCLRDRLLALAAAQNAASSLPPPPPEEQEPEPVFRFGGNNEIFGIWARNKLEGGGTDVKGSWWGITGRHYMTKRTWLYAGVAHAKNELEGAATGLATAKSPTTFAAAVTVNATSQTNPTGIQVGVATTF